MLLSSAGAIDADDSFLPLTDGNTWEYSVNGQAMIQKVEQVKGGPWVLITSVEGQGTVREWLTVDRDGIQSLKMEQASGTIEYPKPLLILKLPAKPGQKWSQKLNFNGQEGSVDSEIVGPESVKVPAGTFEAILVISRTLMQGLEIGQSTWYAAGIGMVKRIQETRFQGKRQSVTFELAKYELKEDAGLKCSNCGLAGRPGQKFCVKCGGKIELPTNSQEGYKPSPEAATEFVKAENHLTKDEWDEAEAALGRAIAMEPKFAMAWHFRAFIRRDRGKLKEALADVNEALRVGVSRPSGLWLRGRIYFDMKEYAKAKPDLEEAVRLLPNIKSEVRPLLTKIDEELKK